jgi:hypothetical protein
MSQRHRVAPLMVATKPSAITSGRSPWSEKRDYGMRRRGGNSQARALISTTTLGGKAGWRPAPGLLLEAGEAELTESFAPLAHDLPRGIQTCGDHVVGQALGGQQHDLGSEHVAIR